MDGRYVAQRNEIRSAVRQHIIDKILFGDADRLEDTVSFQESGVLDSVGFLEVITFVEERFHVQITDGELVPENFDSVERIADFVHGKQNNKTVCGDQGSGR